MARLILAIASLTAGLFAALFSVTTHAQQPPLFTTSKVDGTDGVYTFRYQNSLSMFIVTPAGVIATDPIGYGRPQAVQTYLEEIRKITDKPIKYVLYSHHHFDHIAGGKPFKDAGADQHCQKLAAAAGASGKTWRAYLSTQGRDGAQTVNARDRIGTGPWYNAKGVRIASDVDNLHSANNNVNKETALNEKGQVVQGRGDKPNRHDILTGSRTDGTAFGPGDPDMTCGNWTRSGAEGVAVVGHHDRDGPTKDPWATSWNSSHQTRGGCSQKALIGTGGDGLIYCFAAN